MADFRPNEGGFYLAAKAAETEAEAEALTFSKWDYLVFGLSLVLSTAIGFVMAVRECRRTGKQPKDAGPDRSFQGFPAVLSICASLLAANFILGSPAELYYLGSGITLLVAGAAVSLPGVLWGILLPLYHRGYTSVFTYMEDRFGRLTKGFCVLQFSFALILYLGVALYAPSLAFSQVSSVSVEVALVATGLVCTVYTTAGGLKGVLWIDTVQMLTVQALVAVVVGVGTQRVGGMGLVWETAWSGGRLQPVSFSPDPRVRHTFWTQMLGGAALTWALFTNQAIVQKFMALPSQRSLKWSSFAVLIAVEVTLLLVFLSGLVIYADYEGCDPLLRGLITKPDQLLPFYALDLFQSAPGVTGLFMAAIYGASLSSVAGGINALAALTMADIVGPALARRRGKQPLSATARLAVFKALSAGWGLVLVAAGFVAPRLGAGVIQLSFSLLNISGGPVTGLLLLGLYVPAANGWGALAGLGASLALVYLVAVGGIITGAPAAAAHRLPLSTAACPTSNTSHPTTTTEYHAAYSASPDTTLGPDVTSASPADSYTGILGLFQISYMWYAVLGLVTVLLVGTAVSYLTGGNQNREYSANLVRRIQCKRCRSSDEAEKDQQSEQADPPSYQEHQQQQQQHQQSNNINEQHQQPAMHEQPHGMTGCSNPGYTEDLSTRL